MQKVMLAIALLCFAFGIGMILAERLSVPDTERAQDADSARGVASSGGASSEETGPSSKAGDPQSSRQASRPAPAVRDARGGAESALQQSPPAPTHEAAMKAVLEGIPLPAIQFDDKSITGTIRSANGAPQPGVRVTATPASVPPAEAVSGEQSDSLAALVRASVYERRWKDAARCEAVSDTQGFFELRPLARDTEYIVLAESPGFEFRAEGGEGNLAPGNRADFISSPVALVSVDVRMPDGSQAESAQLLFEPLENRGVKLRDWTRARARISLPFGKYEASARSGDRFASGVAELVISDAQPAADLRLELAPTAGIRGQVRFSDWLGRHHSMELWLYYLRVQRGEEIDADKLARQGSRRAVLDDDGTFQLNDLDPGIYALGVERVAGGGIETLRQVEVTSGYTRCDLELPALAEANTLTIWLSTPSGTPKSFPKVRLWSVRKNQAPTVRNLGVVLRANGSYAAFLSPLAVREMRDAREGSEGTPAERMLEVDLESYPKQRIPLPLKGNELHVRFASPAFLTVRVHAGTPGSASRLEVRLIRDGESPAEPAQSSALPNPEQFEFGPLSTGAWELLASLRGEEFKSLTQRLPVIALQLAEGFNEFTVTIPALYNLRVGVPDAKAGMMIELTDISERSQHAVFGVNDRGEADCKMLLAGEYQVDLRGADASSGETMRVSLTADMDLIFKRQIKRFLDVTINDNDPGTLRQAGIVDGDIIVGIDGKRFTNEKQMLEQLEAAKSRKQFFFVVERDGGESYIDFSGAQLTGHLGGSLTPTSK